MLDELESYGVNSSRESQPQPPSSSSSSQHNNNNNTNNSNTVLTKILPFPLQHLKLNHKPLFQKLMKIKEVDVHQKIRRSINQLCAEWIELDEEYLLPMSTLHDPSKNIQFKSELAIPKGFRYDDLDNIDMNKLVHKRVPEDKRIEYYTKLLEIFQKIPKRKALQEQIDSCSLETINYLRNGKTEQNKDIQLLPELISHKNTRDLNHMAENDMDYLLGPTLPSEDNELSLSSKDLIYTFGMYDAKQDEELQRVEVLGQQTFDIFADSLYCVQKIIPYSIQFPFSFFYLPESNMLIYQCINDQVLTNEELLQIKKLIQTKETPSKSRKKPKTTSSTPISQSETSTIASTPRVSSSSSKPTSRSKKQKTTGTTPTTPSNVEVTEIIGEQPQEELSIDAVTASLNELEQCLTEFNSTRTVEFTLPESNNNSNNNETSRANTNHSTTTTSTSNYNQEIIPQTPLLRKRLRLSSGLAALTPSTPLSPDPVPESTPVNNIPIEVNNLERRTDSLQEAADTTNTISTEENTSNITIQVEIIPDFILQSMSSLTLEQCNQLLLGRPMLYCHHGSCLHHIILLDIRSFHRWKDQSYALLIDYPREISRKSFKIRHCYVCNALTGEYLVYNDRLAETNPCLYCRFCYQMLHYDAEGKLLYHDFQVYPYYHDT